MLQANVADGEKWPNSGWWAAFSAFLGHFSPFHAKIYPDFWKRYRSVEVSERCVASTFLSFRNYLQSRQYKNYECQQSFFLLPLSPPFSFLSRVVSRLVGVQKSQFRCRSGENGQIFRSHLFKNPGRCCKQMLPDGEKWPNSGWWAAFSAFLGHFSPFHAKIYPDFWKRYRSVEVSERCVASTFCRSETISKVGNIKIMSASSPFFFSPLSPPFSFLSRVVSRLVGVQKSQFRCRSGENGQIFRSHLFKNPGRCCKQMLPDGEKWPNSGWWAAFSAFLGHFSPFHAKIYPDFWKRYRSVEVSERCVASTFLSFRNYLQSRQYKNYECQQSFFFSPLSPPFSFLSRVVSRLVGVQKSQFRCRSGENGQIFRSHLFKNPGRCCKQMLPDGEKWPNSGWWAAFSAFLGHFSPFHAKIYPDFWKRYRSVEVSERCVASTFLSFRNYLQSRQYKNYECQQSFFLLPSLPSLLFSLPCGF